MNIFGAFIVGICLPVVALVVGGFAFAHWETTLLIVGGALVIGLLYGMATYDDGTRPAPHDPDAIARRYLRPPNGDLRA